MLPRPAPPLRCAVSPSLSLSRRTHLHPSGLEDNGGVEHHSVDPRKLLGDRQHRGEDEELQVLRRLGAEEAEPLRAARVNPLRIPNAGALARVLRFGGGRRALTCAIHGRLWKDEGAGEGEEDAEYCAEAELDAPVRQRHVRRILRIEHVVNGVGERNRRAEEELKHRTELARHAGGRHLVGVRRTDGAGHADGDAEARP
jgi:hypothetical protein